MKKSKIPYMIYIMSFFIICLLFVLLMIIPGASDAEEGSSGFPAFITDEGINRDFGDEFEDWFSKNFAFRSEVVSAFSALKENVFESGNDQVIVGKDSFLFFDESVKSYTGEFPMTEEEISLAAEALRKISDYVSSKGAEFIFMAAPGKESIYPDKLPLWIRRSEKTDTDLLYEALDENGVRYADMREVLKEAGKSEEKEIYYKRDSHWNHLGASYVIASLMDKTGKTAAAPSADVKIRTDFAGDLDRLLYPGEKRTEEESVPSYEGLYIYTSAFQSEMDLEITARGTGKGKLLMFRDSFANALIPGLASSFEEVRFSRVNPYKADALEEDDYDLVIVEVAERNLRDLIGSDARVPGEK